MAWMRRKSADGEQPAPTREAADLAARPWVDRLAGPCARIDLGPPAGSRATSLLGGTPYLPVGTPWPAVDGEPAQFVCQVDFAEVPPLPGFPAAGLLQWFVPADERFDDDDDDDGLVPATACRWFAQAAAPSWEPDGPAARLPFGIAPGTSLAFRASRSLPSWDELPEDVQALAVWPMVAAAYRDKNSRQRRGYDGVRGYEGIVRNQDTETDFGLTSTSMIGGYADELPDTVRDAEQLILQLFTGYLTGYADHRGDIVGELWGDPRAVAAGDLSQLRHRWY